jgi:chemotaxis protein CheX
MEVCITSDMVAEIVQSIFSTMIGMDVSVAAEAASFPKGDGLTSSVYLEGDWNGAVCFECNRQHACHIAGRFLSINPPDVIDDDVRDVLGELANMIGGNIKSTISSDVRLSLPSVVDGQNYRIHVCGSDVETRMAFRFPEGVFWVTILAKENVQIAREPLCGVSQAVM